MSALLRCDSTSDNARKRVLNRDLNASVNVRKCLVVYIIQRLYVESPFRDIVSCPAGVWY
jgi:hypothetical protein